MVWKDINKESRVLTDKLKLLSFKISAAESCTGGLLSSAIVNNSGASDAFERSFITYSNEAKINILKINENLSSKKLNYVNTRIENIRVIKGTNFEYFSEGGKNIFFEKVKIFHSGVNKCKKLNIYF